MKQVISLFFLILLFFSVSLAAYERRELKSLQVTGAPVPEIVNPKNDEPAVVSNNGLQSFCWTCEEVKAGCCEH